MTGRRGAVPRQAGTPSSGEFRGARTQLPVPAPPLRPRSRIRFRRVLRSVELLPTRSLQVVGSVASGFGSYRDGCEILGQAGEKRVAFFGGNP